MPTILKACLAGATRVLPAAPVLAACLSGFLSACGREPADDRFRVLCTFLPVYVLTLNVVGDTPGVRVELLLEANTGCPHGHAARASDLKRAAAADLILANGLGIEPFLDQLSEAGGRAAVAVITGECELLAAGDAGSAETAPAAAQTTACDHPGPCAGHHHHHDEASRFNPHVWVSPQQAAIMVRAIVRELSRADPVRAAAYQANGRACVARLEALHDEMKAAASGFASRKIVTFHDAFDYLARDLGLEVVATLTVEPGEPVPAGRLAEVIRRARDDGAAAVFREPAYSDRAAETVARDAGVPLFELNPLNSLPGPPDAGAYERVMRENLAVLRKALGTPVQP